ncbi:MAG: ABC transporter substrate-binding protein [Anaerolineales bacterium]|nr:ABC transporter substrate-binding protein [Anaerolineales bacterium]
MHIRKLLLPTLLALALAACGSTVDTVPLRVLSETATTRTIEHTFGTTEIPAAPQRVIALGEEGLLADLLDAGITPLASIVNLPDYLPALIAPQEVAGVELYSSSTSVSLERLAALEPDVIIGTAFFVDRIGYAKLSQIAPTIAVAGENEVENYAQTLTALGLADEASSRVADFEVALQAARSQLGSAVDASVAAIYPGNSVAVFTDRPRTVPWLLRQLGVSLHPDGSEEGLSLRDGRAFISLERLDLLSGTQLFLLQNDSVEGEAESLAEVSANPLWQQIPAVQAGRVTVLDRLGYPGFRGVNALLQDLMEALAVAE